MEILSRPWNTLYWAIKLDGGSGVRTRDHQVEKGEIGNPKIGDLIDKVFGKIFCDVCSFITNCLGIEMEKNKFKKIGVVVPTELDFVRAIRLEYQIPDCVPLPDRVCDDDISEIREGFAFKVMSAGRRLSHKFTEVLHEFPNVYRLDPLYASLLHQRYNMDHYDRAVSEVSHAQEMVDAISGDYVKLLLKDDCDSRDKCKSLRVTFAKRSIPALAFLDKVR